LADYQAHIDQFKEENVDIIALSVDPLDKAKEMAERVTATFPIGYGLEVPRDADKVGAYWEERRKIIHATNFVIDAEESHAGLLCHGSHWPHRRRRRSAFCAGSQEKESSGKLITNTDNFTDNSNGLLAIGPADVSMGYHADAGPIHGPG
jgi:AhpC/TSA family